MRMTTKNPRLTNRGPEYDRTKSYVRQDPDFVVYADPHFSNRIDFSVYAAPQTERAGTKRTKGPQEAMRADAIHLTGSRTNATCANRAINVRSRASWHSRRARNPS